MGKERRARIRKEIEGNENGYWEWKIKKINERENDGE